VPAEWTAAGRCRVRVVPLYGLVLGGSPVQSEQAACLVGFGIREELPRNVNMESCKHDGAVLPLSSVGDRGRGDDGVDAMT
jgi:hypothetical protein